MNAVPLGELVERCRQEWLPQAPAADEAVRLVEPSSIDPRTHEIRPVQVRPHQALSQSLQVLRAGDVIIPKVRPERGLAAVVPPDLNGALASTRLCTLRPLPNRLRSRYLFHWVRSRLFWRQVSDHQTVTYPTLSFGAVREFSMPLPDSVTEQDEVVRRLDRIDELQAARRRGGKILKQLDAVLLSHLQAATAACPHHRLADVAEVRVGVAGDTEGEGEAALLTPGNLNRGWLDLSNTKWTALDAEEEESFFCREGDVLFARTIPGYTQGRMAVFTSAAVTSAGIDSSRVVVSPLVVRVRPRGDLLPHYLESCLRTPQAQLAAASQASVQSVLSLAQLAELPIPIPALYVQQQVQEIRLRLLAVRARQEQAEGLLAQLYESVAGRAFRGER